MVEGKKVKEPSDSSASATIHLPLPSFAFVLYLLIIPPFITVGSNFACSIIDATNEVVVVLPCEPATVMAYFKRINSASIFALVNIGIPLVFDSFNSSLFFFIADEIIIKSILLILLFLWPIFISIPIFSNLIVL